MKPKRSTSCLDKINFITNKISNVIPFYSVKTYSTGYGVYDRLLKKSYSSNKCNQEVFKERIICNRLYYVDYGHITY